MRQCIGIGLGLGGLSLLAACAAPSATTPPPSREIPVSMTREATPLAYQDAQNFVDALIPQMGAEQVTDRAAAQQKLEQRCFVVGRPGAADERTALCHAMAKRLGGDTPRPARVWLLRQLERIGGAESVPALALLLDETDEEIRDLARRCLLKNAAPSAGAALRTALTRANAAEWKAALITALAMRRDVHVVPLLLQMAHDRDDAVARAAIAGLGTIGDPQTVGFLRGLRLAAPDTRQATVTAALLRGVDQLLADGHRALAGTVCADLLQTSEDPAVRCGALRGLVVARGNDALPKLLAILGDASAPATVAAVAAEQISGLSGANVTVSAAQALLAAPPTTQVLLLDALGRRGDIAARPAVKSLLDSSDVAVRVAAVEALALLGDAETAVTLVELAAEARRDVRDAARVKLSRMTATGINAALVEALSGSEPGVQAEILRALHARECDDALPTYFEYARSAAEDVAMAALAAIATFGEKSHVPRLVEILLAADADSVQLAAADAIVAVANRSGDPALGARAVLAGWDQAAVPQRAIMVRVMRRIGGKAALAHVRATLESNAPELVDVAVRSLAKWKTADAVDDLLRIARESGNRTHRVLSLRGALRLLDEAEGLSAIDALKRYKLALDVCERADERRLALSGLAKVRAPGALRMIMEQLDDDTVRAEAEMATIACAERIAPLAPTQARAALNHIVTNAERESRKQMAQKALGTIPEFDGHLTAWQISGPYTLDGQDWEAVYEHAFAPEDPAERISDWRLIRMTSDEQPWRFSFGWLGCGDCCVYARSAVWSEEDRDIRLEVGSDDAFKLWLNNERVHQYRGLRGHTPFENHAAARLKAGWNPILVKVVQHGGGWEFSCRLRTPDGEALEGLRQRARMPAGR